MIKHVSLLTHYDLDGAVSHHIAKKAFMIKFPQAKMDMKCCGYGKVSAKLKELAELGNDVLVITDLMVDPEDMKFAVKHWREIYYFDHHLESEKYGELATMLGGKMTYRYDVEMSASAIVYKWAVQEINVSALKTPKWQKLVQLTNTYDLWKTNRPEWQDAFDLNELFWSKHFWKFSDRFCATGFEKFSSYEKRRVKELKDEKLEIIRQSPKEKWGENAAFIFLKDSKAINLVEFVMSDIDYFYIAYPRGDSADIGLSVRCRENLECTDRAMNVSDGLMELVKNFPNVFSGGGGHELAGGAETFSGVKIGDVIDGCRWLNEKINMDGSLPF